MGYYNFLNEVKRLLKNRKFRRFLFVIMIVYTILVITNNVLATDGSQGGGEGGGGFRDDFDVVFDEYILQYIDDAIYNFYSFHPLNQYSLFYYVEDYNSYFCISTSNTNFIGIIDSSPTNLYDLDVWLPRNTGDLFLYIIPFDNYEVERISVVNKGTNGLSAVFGDYSNCFSLFNFMYFSIPSNAPSDWVAMSNNYNNNEYIKKTISIEPYINYFNNSYIINDNIVVSPANTRVGENTFIPFTLEIWNTEGENLSEDALSVSINCNTSSLYWDSTLKVYNIPWEYIRLWCANDGEYSILVNLFGNDHFYMKKEILTFTISNNNVVFPNNPDSPDNPNEPSSPDYSEDLTNINNGIDNINGGITDINDSLNNDNVDDMTSDFSSLGEGFSMTDPSGLEQIFQKLYNAFCTDEVINLTFIIPFVNKQVTISSANISSNFPQSVKSIVSVFVWGMIGLWVLKDVRTMVNKASEGSPESVGSDIKKEVL